MRDMFIGIIFVNRNKITQETLIGMITTGYAGTDFIEVFMTRT